MKHSTPTQIDAILPQTQCGLCGHGGCMPYATAIAQENAAINLCPPGGVAVLKKLGELTQQDPTPFIADMQQQEKPRMLAKIREDECIGCTKCIVACPVDAIMGASKQMHSVIASECTGCELCVAPCPVDCIDMVALSDQHEAMTPAQSDHWRMRYQARNARLERIKVKSESVKEIAPQATKQDYIQAALARVKSNKIKRF